MLPILKEKVLRLQTTVHATVIPVWGYKLPYMQRLFLFEDTNYSTCNGYSCLRIQTTVHATVIPVWGYKLQYMQRLVLFEDTNYSTCNGWSCVTPARSYVLPILIYHRNLFEQHHSSQKSYCFENVLCNLIFFKNVFLLLAKGTQKLQEYSTARFIKITITFPGSHSKSKYFFVHIVYIYSRNR